MINININNLINLIKLIHLALILFIIIAPFFGQYYLALCIALLVGIIYKWKIDGSCLLTKIEYKLLGYDNEHKGFIYRLINPIFNIEEQKWKGILEKLSIIWLIILSIFYILKYS
jgi:hypothetical protein